jgi:hypothetical protein
MALRTLARGTIDVDNTAGGVSFPAAAQPGELGGNNGIKLIKCHLDILGGAIRVETEADNNGNPTDAVTATLHGTKIEIDTRFEVTGADDIKNFRGIEVTSTNGILHWQAMGDGNPA